LAAFAAVAFAAEEIVFVSSADSTTALAARTDTAATFAIAAPEGTHRVMSTLGDDARTSTCFTPNATSEPAAAVAFTLNGMLGDTAAVFGAICDPLGPPVRFRTVVSLPATVRSMANVAEPAFRAIGPLRGPGSILTRPEIVPPVPTLSGIVMVTVTVELGSGFWLNFVPSES